MTTGSPTTTDLQTAQTPQNLHQDSGCFGPLIKNKQPVKPSKNTGCIKTVTAKPEALSTVVTRE